MPLVMTAGAAFKPGGVRLGPWPKDARRAITRGDGVTYIPFAPPRERIKFLSEAVREFVRQHRIAPYTDSDATRLLTVEHVASDLHDLLPRETVEADSTKGVWGTTGEPKPRYDYEHDLWDCLKILQGNALFEVDPDGSVRRVRAGALERMWNIAARLDSLSREYGDTPRAQVTRAVVSSPPPRKPLTDGQQAVWQALKGRCLSAKELVLQGKASSDDGVRKLVSELRKAGRMIETRRGCGYYRPDAPPADDEAT